MSTITTTGLLRYPGGKTRAKTTLARYLDSKDEKILSPFFGGGSFELYATGKGHKVDGYDAFYPVACFWNQVINHPKKLAENISSYLGKVDKEMFKTLQAKIKDRDFTDDMELATLFFVINRCSFSGATLSGGFSASAAKDRFTLSSVERVENFLNPHLEVSYGNAFDILQDDLSSYDLIFLDPPYKLDDSFLYGVQGDTHRGFNHQEFADLVHRTGKDNKILLTYNDSSDIREMYSGFRIDKAQWSYGMNASKKSSEVIISNF